MLATQVKIIHTGSTNMQGMTMTLEKSGPHVTLARTDGSTQHTKVPKDMCQRLLVDLKAAGPLNQLPAAHCMKSVSFGTSLFIESDGLRSPDLNCPQTDPRADALKKDASDILALFKTFNAPKHF
jgi:hypothetical protein